MNKRGTFEQTGREILGVLAVAAVIYGILRLANDALSETIARVLMAPIVFVSALLILVTLTAALWAIIAPVIRWVRTRKGG